MEAWLKKNNKQHDHHMPPGGRPAADKGSNAVMVRTQRIAETASGPSVQVRVFVFLFYCGNAVTLRLHTLPSPRKRKHGRPRGTGNIEIHDGDLKQIT